MHRTCFRAVAQIPFEQLVAHKEKLESLNERVGMDGGEEIEKANEKASSSLTLAFSLVISNIVTLDIKNPGASKLG